MKKLFGDSMIKTQKLPNGGEQHLVLTFEDTADGRKIFLNGIDITNWLCSFEVQMSPNDVNHIHMEFIGVEIRQIKSTDPFYGL